VAFRVPEPSRTSEQQFIASSTAEQRTEKEETVRHIVRVAKLGLQWSLHILSLVWVSSLLASAGFAQLLDPSHGEILYSVDLATQRLVAIDSYSGAVDSIYQFHDLVLGDVDLAMANNDSTLYLLNSRSGISIELITINLRPSPTIVRVRPVTLRDSIPNIGTAPPYPEFNCGGDRGHFSLRGWLLQTGVSSSASPCGPTWLHQTAPPSRI